jgi:HEAT repeat protein
MVRRMLIDRLSDPAAQVRHAAAGALGRLGLQPVEVRSTLIDLARGSDDYTTRMVALHGLGSFGGRDSEAQAAARDALRDEDPAVRAVAVGTLASWIGETPDVADLVLLSLEDQAPGVRAAASQSLRGVVKPPRDLLPRLVRLLEHDDSLISTTAAATLGNMGVDAQTAAPLLWRQQVRAGASSARGGGWQSAYLSAIARIAPGGPEAREAIAALVAIVREGRDELRPLAAVALAEFGAHALAAIPELRKAGESPDARLRRAAAMSIWRIEAARQQAFAEERGAD